ncbi:hypothetical protein KL928_000557 [Ogataea angusta]|uniref:Uncharacterized protein n=1 Tax=Pichia angusta TaxID=870730 RepID=A0AAN6I7Z0_PICAN|nr:uncharacterized protein KL928_000557 [Ogataea angusta]KAG7822082.1 hypothetical protein KL928_000557 [Ogataea angusta]
MLTSTYYDLFELTLKFPKATLGDAIKVAEIELYLGLSRGLASSPLSYYIDGELLCFPEQQEWKQKWSKIIQKDVSQMLTSAYNFAHIMLARKLTLNRFLLLSNNLVKGSPSFQLNLVVYACITLCDYLDTMGADERRMSLNLISKIYWHLNKVGEKMNDATDTIAKIVRKLVDIANETHSQTPKARNSSQNSETLSVADLPQQVAEQLYSPAESYALSSHAELRLPDVAAFDNFEDFFKDLFDT